jgi:UDP-glucose 4-epimerase
MRTLITGGSGFIGSHLVDQLLNKGIEVKVYDNFTSGNLKNLANVKSKIEIIQADIRSLDTLIASMQGVDCVFHLAALTAVSQSVADPILTHEINVTGTLNVLWASLKAGVSRVVIASSCAVYGDTHHPPLKETDLPAPKSPYAASKLIAETLAESFYHSYGLETVSLRYFNVYGSRQRPDSEYASVIPRFIQCYKNKTAPLVYGDGLQSRDFIHVTDISRANILAALLPSNIVANYRVFNIGTGLSSNILELLEILSNQASYSLKPEYQDARIADIRDSAADCNLARDQLGFFPLVELSKGIKDLYNV